MTSHPTRAGHADGVGWSLQAQLLRAELRGDEREWRRLLDLNRQAGGEFGVMPAAFVLLLHRWFAGIKDRRDVTRCVARYNSAAPPEHRVPTREAEAVLRANLGEPHLADLVDEETTLLIMYSLLFWLVHELRLSEEQMDDLVVAADELAERAERVSGIGHESTLDLKRILEADAIRWRPPAGAKTDLTADEMLG
ncbi:hypothetical protein ABZ744_31460 [Micromonospora chersina]|uniref:hypothetical protein n=1 Tax=Micromonospora chersina TaxID=47854 RepID=UPI0033CC2FAB